MYQIDLNEQEDEINVEMMIEKNYSRSEGSRRCVKRWAVAQTIFTSVPTFFFFVSHATPTAFSDRTKWVTTLINCYFPAKTNTISAAC